MTAAEAKRAEQQSPEPSSASDVVSPPQQAMTSAVPAGGPDDASPSSEMAGLEIKDGGAPRTDDEDSPAMPAEGGAEGQQSRPSNYKSRLCMKWQQHGECSFGNRCNFAHGSDELRGGGSTTATSAANASSSSASHAAPHVAPGSSGSNGAGPKGEQQQQQQQQQNQQHQQQQQQQAQQQQRDPGHRGTRAGENRASGSPWNRKTRLCTKWCNTGQCPYGDRCNFAHGHHELKHPRPNSGGQWEEEAIVQQQQQMGSMGGMLAMGGMMQGMPPMPPMMASAAGNPKNSNYKTRICLNWHKTGHCQYAQRCNFAHGQIELRPTYKDMSLEKGGFGHGGMRGHGGMQYHPQMGHSANNGGHMHMQPQMSGPGSVQGMQGMQFNGMLMQMPMAGMPGMPDMNHHMMSNMLGGGMMAGMPMMMDMEQLKQQMGHMSMEQINAMALPGGQPARGRHGNMIGNMGGPGGAQGGMMMAGMPNGMPVPAAADAAAASESPTAAAAKQEPLPPQAAPVA